MRKVMFIEFNPQDIKDTNEAIKVALEEKVLMKPCSNLIKTDCLHALTLAGFEFCETIDYGSAFKFYR